MTFYADLHIHSKYSRATSRDCDLEHMSLWARKKGVAVLGTGDFTHPRWLQEIEEKLVPAEPGLFRLRPDLEKLVDEGLVDEGLGGESGEPVRFMLEVEISTIYKKDDRTRKVHHLIYAPDLRQARNLIERLSRIGNLASDGRPILGLDSRDLLEITLESGDGCYLIPAHIWTPWFAVLGSKSGFDTLEHCYGDLAPEIFAVETGLSSDPPMNFRLSRLDRYTLVSNSDAHSPPKIGREACRFDTELDYFAMRRALETGVGYGGTVEFFPEEGKYHLDGHRKCNVCLSPEQAKQHDGVCPVCGKPLTLGVMHRVDELADRDETPDVLPPKAAPYRSLVPLAEVLSEIHGVGPKSKTVQENYGRTVKRLGSELFILEGIDLEDVKRAGSSLLAEALDRMRQGRVIRQAGFDGEYGVIRLFTREELLRGTSVGLLFDPEPDDPDSRKHADSRKDTDSSKHADSRKHAGSSTPIESSTPRETRSSFKTRTGCNSIETASSRPTGDAQTPAAACEESQRQAMRLTRNENEICRPAEGDILDQLDPEQRAAAEITQGPLLIVAGPGTGKTRTLTHRFAHLVANLGVPPRQCLAITFTNRAAGEMTERLSQLLPGRFDKLPVMTFHGLGHSMLREHGARLGLSEPVRVAGQAECVELLGQALGTSEQKARRLLKRIALRKRGDGPHAVPTQTAAKSSETGLDAEIDEAFAAYERALNSNNLVDFDDLIVLPVRLLDSAADLVELYRSRYRWLSVDEYQDVDRWQYELIKLLVPRDGNLCVIGDPDQSIYGFRGADVQYFQRFQDDFPAAQRIALARNYRSTRAIVDASLQLIAPSSLVADRHLQTQLEGPDQIEIHECSTDRAEAEFVVHTVERTIGGSTFFSIDSGRVESHEGEDLSFSDFAVLYRTDAQSGLLVEAFARSGIPFQKRSHNNLADDETVRALMRIVGEGEARHPENECLVDLVNQTAAGMREAHPRIELFLPALRKLAGRYQSNLRGFLSELSLGVDVDLWDPRAESVSLLTLHAAKGLEFPVVFIVGVEDGLVPLHWGSSQNADSPATAELSEERRLFFVGMTRAERRLYLTHACRRHWRGRVRAMDPSPFLQDIQQQLLAFHQHRPGNKRAARHEQLTFFDQ